MSAIGNAVVEAAGPSPSFPFQLVHLARRMLLWPLVRRGELAVADAEAPSDAVREMERRVKFEFRRLVENSIEGVAVVQDGHIRFANRSAAAMLGYDHPELLVLLRSAFHIFAPSDRGRAERLCAKLQSRHQGHARFALRLPRPDNVTLWVQVQMQQVDWRGQPGLLVSLADITRRKALEDELRRLATYDALTGAANRRHFLDRAGVEIDRSRRYRYPLALLALDLDRFKSINDTHGHGVGDAVLKQVSRRILSMLRDSDVFGRIGGEEFSLLLPNTDLEGAAVLAERLRSAIESMDVVAGPQHVPLSVSIGVADGLGGFDENVSEGLARADMALYRAKRLGRNRIEIADPARPPYAGEGI